MCSHDQGVPSVKTPPTLGVTIKGLSKKFPQNNVPFASAVQLSHFTEGKQIAEP